MPERVWAVVVARVGNGAKSRLAVALDAADRRQLALAMLSDVLAVCASAHFDGVVAVVDDQEASSLAERLGAMVVQDPSPAGMNAAVGAGIATAEHHGATTIIVLPVDVPAVTRLDFDALLAAAGESQRAVVVGASRDGQGTNALLLRPPGVIDPAFGPPSVERHVRLAKASGATTRVLHHLGLALDIDTPSDLAALAEGETDIMRQTCRTYARGRTALLL